MKETEAQKRWRLSHKDYYREYSRCWRASHKDSVNESSRRYRVSHPGYQYRQNKKWRLSHPKKRYQGKRRYYRRLAVGSRNGGSSWSAADIELVISDNRPSDRELHEELGRSVAAIQMVRWRATKKALRW